jgi:hypothetical protein
MIFIQRNIRVDAEEEGSGTALHAMVAERFADEDARRKAWLEEKMKAMTCKWCGAKLWESLASRTPGECGQTKCRRSRNLPILRQRTGKVGCDAFTVVDKKK